MATREEIERAREHYNAGRTTTPAPSSGASLGARLESRNTAAAHRAGKVYAVSRTSTCETCGRPVRRIGASDHWAHLGINDPSQPMPDHSARPRPS